MVINYCHTYCKYTVSGLVKVGHTEINNFWTVLTINSPILPDDLIVRSGMAPRDGTSISCYFESGEKISQTLIHPGDKVFIGSKPPKIKKKLTLNSKIKLVKIDSIKEFHNKKRCISWVEYAKNNRICIPGNYHRNKIKIFELFKMRVKNRIISYGYRIRNSSKLPYESGDLSMVMSSGRNKLKLFDPITNDLTIDVIIHPDSLVATKKMMKERCKKTLWIIKIISFNSDRRTAFANVDRKYTWPVPNSKNKTHI